MLYIGSNKLNLDIFADREQCSRITKQQALLPRRAKRVRRA